MWKKLIIICLLMLFAFPIPCNATFTDDIKDFEAKYSSLYSTVDPVLIVKMESFLQDVVDTIVDNYDKDISLNEQINYVVTVVLTDDPEYNEDLLPFLLDQIQKQDEYSNQISEMKAIVRAEVESRLSADTPTEDPVTNNSGSTSSSHGTSNTTLPADKVIEQKLAQNSGTIQLTIDADSNGVTIGADSLHKIVSAAKVLEIKGDRVVLKISSTPSNLPSNGTISFNVNDLPKPTSGSMVVNLPTNSTLGNVYEIKADINNNTAVVVFPKNITITVPYNISDFSGISEELLDVYYYNEGSSSWEKMNGTINKTNKTISFETSHFSKYAILSRVETEEPVTPSNTGVFNDLNGHWAANDINEMVNKGLVKGISATEFAPQRNITRAEFATILLRSLGVTPETQLTGSFYDVPADCWYFETVNTAAKLGLITGYTATSFGPEDQITREQIAVMLDRALAYKNKNVILDAQTISARLAPFEDSGLISSWAQQSVATAIDREIVKGRTTTQFAPNVTATRAEASVMILRTTKQF